MKNESESNGSQSLLTSHFAKASSRRSPEAVVSHLAAVDRISFATLAKSEEIRAGCKAQGLQIPVKQNDIRYTYS
jgi:hypothetical protein